MAFDAAETEWLVELVGDRSPGSKAPPKSKRRREGEREEPKEMPGKERLLEERWRRVDMWVCHE